MSALNAFLLLLVTLGRVEAAPPLTVADAVRIALEQSPKLRAARYEADAAQVQTDRERPVARPTLIARAEGRMQGPQVTFPRAGDGDAVVLPERYGRVELTLDQLLYRPGAGAARERYGAQTRANLLATRRAENDLIRDVRRAYYSLLTAQAMAETAHGGVEMAQRHLDLVKTMLAAGMSAERDVKVSEADLAEAQQGAIRADNGVALARADLNREMGRAPDSPMEATPASALPEVPESAAAGSAAALVRRPEVRLLEENLRAARAGVSLARTQDKPALSARATAAHQTASAFEPGDYLSAGLVVTWPLLDAGKTRADVREAQARTRQLEALLDEARLGIRLEVEKAWRDMGSARAGLAAAERQVEAARAALDVSELRYQARAATQLEVSSALFNVTKARSARAQAVHDLQIAAAEYAHATAADLPAEKP